jgi:hypothetical protein
MALPVDLARWLSHSVVVGNIPLWFSKPRISSPLVSMWRRAKTHERGVFGENAMMTCRPAFATLLSFINTSVGGYAIDQNTAPAIFMVVVAVLMMFFTQLFFQPAPVTAAGQAEVATVTAADQAEVATVSRSTQHLGIGGTSDSQTYNIYEDDDDQIADGSDTIRTNSVGKQQLMLQAPDGTLSHEGLSPVLPFHTSGCRFGRKQARHASASFIWERAGSPSAFTTQLNHFEQEIQLAALYMLPL